MEFEYTTQPPTSNTNLPTPTSMISFINDKNNEAGLPGGLAASIAPADMLNVWNATKLNSKGGTVNTADGNYIFKIYINAHIFPVYPDEYDIN